MGSRHRLRDHHHGPGQYVSVAIACKLGGAPLDTHGLVWDLLAHRKFATGVHRLATGGPKAQRVRPIRQAAAAAALLTLLATSCSGNPAQESQRPATATPVRHLVVIFQENVSFDHYFGTYPHAANTDGQPFTACPDTPAVDGLTPQLLAHNPNRAQPMRLGERASKSPAIRITTIELNSWPSTAGPWTSSSSTPKWQRARRRSSRRRA
jgi:Phosphoesterase family